MAYSAASGCRRAKEWEKRPEMAAEDAACSQSGAKTRALSALLALCPQASHSKHARASNREDGVQTLDKHGRLWGVPVPPAPGRASPDTTLSICLAPASGVAESGQPDMVTPTLLLLEALKSAGAG